MPAIVAVWQVDRKPKMSAEGPMTEIIFARDGARPEMTPIWMPRLPMFATWIVGGEGGRRQCRPNRADEARKKKDAQPQSEYVETR